MYRKKWNDICQMLKLLALGGGITNKFDFFLLLFCVCQILYNDNMLQSAPPTTIIIIPSEHYKEAHHFKEKTSAHGTEEI